MRIQSGNEPFLRPGVTLGGIQSTGDFDFEFQVFDHFQSAFSPVIPERENIHCAESHPSGVDRFGNGDDLIGEGQVFAGIIHFGSRRQTFRQVFL